MSGKEINDGPGTLRGTARELQARTWLQNAQRRSARRKSAWNLLLVLIFPLWLAIWWALVEAGYMMRFVLHGWSAPLWADWVRYFNGPLTLPEALLVFAPTIPALAVAGLLGNFGIYLIGPARRAMDAEDRDYPEVNYKASQRVLSLLALYTAPVALVLMLAGAWWM